MPTIFKLYMVLWLSACVAALVLGYRARRRLVIGNRAYWRFLATRWRIITFSIAAGCMVVIAPWTGDPTWDYVDAGFMSLLTYISAPWVMGVVYHAVWRKPDWTELFVATCCWLFTASWSYDGYLVLRDGVYPFSWLPNLFASSVLYISGGLFWSLQWQNERGVHFAFTEPGWPRVEPAGGFGKVVVYATPFMLIVIIMIGSFLV